LIPHTFKRCNRSTNSQRGVITLIISLVILMLSTFVVFNVSKAILLEQKISNNDNRAKQAFEAAEAGMNVALHYLGNDPDVDGNLALDPVFAPDVNGLGTTNTATIGRASVTVSYVDPANLTAPSIIAVGLSDDRTATRTIRQLMASIDPLPNRPENPLIVKGSVTINGSATIENKEGFSTIWSGDDVIMGGGAGSETSVPDIGDPGYPACMDIPLTCELVSTSLNLGVGVDVIENDSSLGDLTPDEFFVNYFGMNETTYRATRVTMDTTNPADADLATSEVIWIEGNVSIGNITVGCSVSVTGAGVCPANKTKPSIIIINGNVDFTGTPQFYGVLYVTGNATMSGSTTIYGSAIVEGNAVSGVGGSLDIKYSSTAVDDTALAGASAGKAGTWRDF
jgi:hypothetical protein